MFGLKKFARSESGVAAVEFGIWLAFGVPLLLTSVDFALYNIDRINTNKAISEASMYVFNDRADIGASAQNTVRNIIVSSSGIAPSDVDVIVTCNGNANCTNTNRELKCLESSSIEVPFSSLASSSLCADGTPPGYFMTIETTVTTRSLYEGFASPPSQIQNTVTVKLE